VKLHEGKPCGFAGTAWKPESMPAAGVVMFEQGAPNVDCVTVWFPPMKTNEMVSPTLAFTLGGSYATAPPLPTITVMLFCAETDAARMGRAAIAAVEKRILIDVS